ncbi:hypothetical protein ACBP89_25365 [Aneurinibacillus aneurinilyticus]|uniref:hypothetical protein n=1 Tax=Aneurinibacillus aneurinilyticus TaxID=1391 RepID=UPI0035266894
MNVYKKIGEVADTVQEIKQEQLEWKKERAEFREFATNVIKDLNGNLLLLNEINKKLDTMIQRADKDKSNIVELKQMFK